MTVATSATPALAGDLCPAWCAGTEHRPCRDEKTHVDDRGTYHVSPVIDEWMPVTAVDHTEPISVKIEGYRHDNVEQWWVDEVYAENVHPGFLSGLGLAAIDARRLGEALIAAADLMQR